MILLWHKIWKYKKTVLFLCGTFFILLSDFHNHLGPEFFIEFIKKFLTAIQVNYPQIFNFSVFVKEKLFLEMGLAFYIAIILEVTNDKKIRGKIESTIKRYLEEYFNILLKNTELRDSIMQVIDKSRDFIVKNGVLDITISELKEGNKKVVSSFKGRCINNSAKAKNFKFKYVSDDFNFKIEKLRIGKLIFPVKEQKNMEVSTGILAKDVLYSEKYKHGQLYLTSELYEGVIAPTYSCKSGKKYSQGEGFDFEYKISCEIEKDKNNILTWVFIRPTKIDKIIIRKKNIKKENIIIGTPLSADFKTEDDVAVGEIEYINKKQHKGYILPSQFLSITTT